MGAAHTQLLAGDTAAALETLLGSDAILTELGERGYSSTVQAFLAQTYEQLGQIDQAHAAIALSETLGSHDDVINHVITHGVRARLALRDGNHDAERWARSAVEHAYMTDSIDLQGHTRLQLGEVLASLGHKHEAIEEARAASDLFAAKGDEFARKKAQQLLDQLSSDAAETRS